MCLLTAPIETELKVGLAVVAGAVPVDGPELFVTVADAAEDVVVEF
jgi:uncharacterized protein YlxW (UPF0749 family)